MIFCAKLVAIQACALLSRLQQVGSKDPQVAHLLLRFCSSFCKMVHLARSTPPSLLAEALSIFDLEDIYRCFTECTSVDISDVAWQQAQLSPSRGGLGLQSLLHQQAQLSPSRGGLGLQSLLHQQAQLSPSRGGLGLQSLLHQQAQLSPSRGGLGLQSLLHQQAQLSPSRGGLGLQNLLHQQAQLSPSRGGGSSKSPSLLECLLRGFYWPFWYCPWREPPLGAVHR